MHRKKVERRSAASAVRSTSGYDLSSEPFTPARGPSESVVQPLEPRLLFAVSMAFEGLVNASKFPGNQSETAVAINRTNPNNLFVSANYGAFREEDQGPNDPIAETGIFTSFSLDNGLTWTPRLIGMDNTGPQGVPDGVSDDGFPIACCDPSAAFDDFGNLYFIYLGMRPLTQQTSVVVLLSTDGGQTFALSAELLGEQPTEPVSVDRCEVTAATLPDGTVSVWVTYMDFSSTAFSVSAIGAHVTGLGNVQPWGAPQKLPQGGPGTGALLPHNLAHPNIGPNGQVSVAHQEVGRNPRDKIFVNTDPDGLGPAPFGNAVFVDATQLTFFEPQPGQPERGVAAVPTLAYDRSNGPHRGRLYIAYAQEVTEDRFGVDGLPIGQSSDSNILLKWSDDNGATWGPAIRVNDDPLTREASQFFQRVAVDQVTGNVAVGWLDSRDDVGGGDTDDEIGYYATVGQPVGSGVVFSPNIRMNVGLSNARFSGNFGNDFGDYAALDINNNVLWVSWPDNSNSTGDNPAGRFRSFDIYAARARVFPDTTPPEPPFVTPASPLSPVIKRPKSLIRKGRFYQLQITYTHPSGVDLASVNTGDIVATGPNGFTQQVPLLKAKARRRGTQVVAIYRLPAPGGTWDQADNGVYTLTLQAGAVTATDGTATVAGTLTRFLVNAKPPRGRGRLLEPAAAGFKVTTNPSSTTTTNNAVFADSVPIASKRGGNDLRDLLK